MVAPVYATDLADIFTDGTTTGWTALGGGASGLAQETDYFIQGTSCLSKQAFASVTKGMIYNNSAGVTVPTDGAVVAWLVNWTPNSMDTRANGGHQFLVGSATSAFKQFYVDGSDTNTFGGWLFAAVDPSLTADATTGSPTTTRQYFGAQSTMVGGPTKGSPFGIDAIRYGRCYLRCTEGDSGNGYATFAGANTYGDAVTRRWGLLSFQKGTYFMSGQFQMGHLAAAVDFRDSNRVIFIRDHPHVPAAFNGFYVQNASSVVQWTNISVTALGTVARGVWNTVSGTVTLTDCQFTDMDTFTFTSSVTATGTTWRRCNAVTAPGSTLTDCTFARSTVAANASAVVWDDTGDPDGNLDGCAFSKGTNAHHAITLGGTNLPNSANVTLRGMTFTDFNASNEQNDSVILLADTGANRTWTINAVGCTGTVSVKKTRAGDSYTVVSDPATYTVLVTDTSGNPIQNARVYVTAAAGGSLTVGDVIISGLTDVDGLISDTRTYATDQPVVGWARKASGAPYYKEGLIAATIDSVAGASTTVQLILDQ